ncbi:protein MpARID3 [Marchantia polymorpha subsp. ruderalis]|uniref:ARID domain-containing protein n=2 Tax=Marchantia polymorpha TaxID=3197 RepID=A0AAF6BW29_MARPO|nr:hypothetical protein MARPO_0062s0083 [Marchantia polymorpha]BBN16213.1 hypothetical protein Mp_7g04420 [Marchantia polymorpha subsp. ruderalis]|eukprot:PTQ36668.1 hypothetical protein MARPO_0062s0083 [Marchantia polymorpha]
MIYASELFHNFIDPLNLMILKLGRSSTGNMDPEVDSQDAVMEVNEDEQIDQERGGNKNHDGSHCAVVQTEVAVTKEQENDAFVETVGNFFREKNLEFRMPKFYGENVDLLKLWREVTTLGGYQAVCSKKLWKRVGQSFDPPKTCTSLSFTFRQFYAKALLEYERCQSGAFQTEMHQTPESDHSFPFPERRKRSALIPKKRARDDTEPKEEDKTQAPCASDLNQDTNSNRLLQCRSDHRYTETSPSDTSGDTWKNDTQHAHDHAAPTTDSEEKEIQANEHAREEDGTNLKERDYKFYSEDTGEARQIEEKGGKDRETRTYSRTRRRKALPSPGKAWMAKGGQEHLEDCEFLLGSKPIKKLKAAVADDDNSVFWVKISAYMTRDDYQIYALVPGLQADELRIECEIAGKVVIAGCPKKPDNLWGITAFRKVIHLPSRIDTRNFQAIVSHFGQLLLRAPFLQET